MIKLDEIEKQSNDVRLKDENIKKEDVLEKLIDNFVGSLNEKKIVVSDNEAK
jgi:hypothetical protein